jgi:hypothetical protein
LIKNPVMKTLFSSAGLLAAFYGTAVAQTNFQLPRECSERHNDDPNQCVIQDGSPPPPWVHKIPLNKPSQPGATPAPVPAPAPTPAPAAGSIPVRRITR